MSCGRAFLQFGSFNNISFMFCSWDNLGQHSGEHLDGRSNKLQRANLFLALGTNKRNFKLYSVSNRKPVMCCFMICFMLYVCCSCASCLSQVTVCKIFAYVSLIYHIKSPVSVISCGLQYIFITGRSTPFSLSGQHDDA